MSRNLLFVLLLLLATGLVPADDVPEAERVAGTSEARTQPDKGDDSESEVERGVGADEAQAQTKEGAKMISGMSILGNQEAPKSLVIVPWKGSEIGDALGISTMLDDSRQPVDKEVFIRALNYYGIRSKVTP